MTNRIQLRTPDQVMGPFYPVGRTPATGGDLTCNSDGPALGEVIEVAGRVVNAEGDPVRGARVLIWQANCFGRYVHPNDISTEAPLDPNFEGFGEVRSDASGAYRIKTVKPGPYATEHGWTRAPHIHFDVHGQFERLVTQMYFPDEPLNRTDRFLLSSRKPDLLIAKTVRVSRPPVGRIFDFDIVLARG